MIIEQVHRHESSHDTYSQISVEAEVSFGGLFYSGSVGGGFSKTNGNSSLTKEGSNLKISFKVRKVIIQRPWLEPSVLEYPTLGIKGLDKGSWSNGKLDKSNEGSFPLLPTACIVAKDVVIQANSFSDTFEKQFSEQSEHVSVKVRYNNNNSLFTVTVCIHDIVNNQFLSSNRHVFLFPPRLA